jgi:type II secretory pathway pseudopilin PulG
MPSRFWLELAAILVAVILCVALFQAWRADQRDRAQLAAELAATKQLLAAADARQRDRDAQLAQTLASLAAEKRVIVTPAQIVRELPREISLPSPIVLQSPPPTSTGANSSSDNSKPAPANAVIPAEDLKPLYDFTLDCKACQAKLTAAQGDLTDERKKTAALTRERDDAVRIAKGGSAWRRISRAAKWFLFGAAAGAIAAKAAH